MYFTNRKLYFPASLCVFPRARVISHTVFFSKERIPEIRGVVLLGRRTSGWCQFRGMRRPRVGRSPGKRRAAGPPQGSRGRGTLSTFINAGLTPPISRNVGHPSSEDVSTCTELLPVPCRIFMHPLLIPKEDASTKLIS